MSTGEGKNTFAYDSSFRSYLSEKGFYFSFFFCTFFRNYTHVCSVSTFACLYISMSPLLGENLEVAIKSFFFKDGCKYLEIKLQTSPCLAHAKDISRLNETDSTIK